MQDEFRDTDTLAQLADAIEAGEYQRCEALAQQHVELGSRALNAALGQL